MRNVAATAGEQFFIAPLAASTRRAQPVYGDRSDRLARQFEEGVKAVRGRFRRELTQRVSGDDL
jgi:hypothetical protein